MAPSAPLISSARRNYPRSAGYPARPASKGGVAEDLDLGITKDSLSTFLTRTVPTEEETKEHIFDKSAADPFRYDFKYASAHLSLQRPDAKLELTWKDRRATRSPPLPESRPHLPVLEKNLRCMDRTKTGGSYQTQWVGGFGGDAPVTFFDAGRSVPPQPIPDATQKSEAAFIDAIETSLKQGQHGKELWDQYAKRAE